MTQKLSIERLETIANDIREDIIRMLEHAGSGHSAGPMGLADIFTALYFDIMNYDPKNPDWEERDILLMSGGHCVPVQYATMAHAGFFDRKELMTLRQLGSRLQGHPERTKLPGLENTSGPLGCGLSQACGMALAMRMDEQAEQPGQSTSQSQPPELHPETHRQIYVTIGDGEQDEGNVWEAAMLASKYHLSNITAITDRNNIQIDGPTESVMPLEDLKDKWQAFGWHVIEIDGNDIDAVIDACAMARAIVEKPVMILAHTIPGKGVDFMEYDFQWHGKPPDHAQAVKALHELRTLGGKIRSEHE
jgi:transketolase